MRCPECGGYVPEGVFACSNCGCPIESTEQNALVQQLVPFAREQYVSAIEYIDTLASKDVFDLLIANGKDGFCVLIQYVLMKYAATTGKVTRDQIRFIRGLVDGDGTDIVTWLNNMRIAPFHDWEGCYQMDEPALLEILEDCEPLVLEYAEPYDVLVAWKAINYGNVSERLSDAFLPILQAVSAIVVCFSKVEENSGQAIMEAFQNTKDDIFFAPVLQATDKLLSGSNE